ncbi:MAG TPA: DMT family transporter [Xanthobacteraceae bacterium]|jgi:drug/metabolite transporter (DMT)-like permease|nr:DMT family transporter [Xanthobacteraceae bacterium]
MTEPHGKLGLALGCAGVVLFGGTLPATRLAVDTIDPLFLTAARAAIAGLAGLGLLLVLRRPPPARRAWRDLFLAGLCTIVGFPALMALAMASVPAAHGGVVLGILPLATAAAATIVAHERPSIGFWLASVAGAAIVLAFVLDESESRTVALGDLFLLGTVAAGGFGYAFSGRLSLSMPGWEVICWQVAGFLPLSVLAMFLLWPHGLPEAPWQAWAGLAYVSLISQFLAFFVFNAALAMAGVARVGQLMLMQPFVIVALAAVVNGETIRPATLAYAGAVVATVLIGQRMRVARR